MKLDLAHQVPVQRTRIKICGLTRAIDVQAAVAAGADALGFVFYEKSARYIAPAQVAQLTCKLAPFIDKVALFVNASAAQVLAAVRLSGANLIQFHGDESADFCAETAAAARLPYVRALGVAAATTAAQLLHWQLEFAQANALLFDTASVSYGGSGQTFDWAVLEQCKTDFAGHPVVLSGGLNAQNVAAAIRQLRPYAVDVSSGVELQKGIKDTAKINAFCQAVRLADAQFHGLPTR